MCISTSKLSVMSSRGCHARTRYTYRAFHIIMLHGELSCHDRILDGCLSSRDGHTRSCDGIVLIRGHYTIHSQSYNTPAHSSNLMK